MAIKIVIAPDKFKGSLSSFEVCNAVEAGLQKASALFKIIKLPMADGGDGLSEVISYYTHATPQMEEVVNPLFEPISAVWLLSADGKTAVIEMAKASGLQLLQPLQYNPLKTTTYGTGQLIKAAIKRGVEQMIIGIGGSATNDGGIGMAAALGYRFMDKNGASLLPVGENLIHIKHIDTTGAIDIHKIEIQVACDVKNLLYGEHGASKVYGPQKGADDKMVEQLEAGMINYAAVINEAFGMDVSAVEGGGAAGGMGAGCVAFLQATLINGGQLILQYAKAEEHIRNADLIITGEGKLDSQTLEAKLVAGIASFGKKYNKPVMVVCGSKTISDVQLQALGVSAAFSIREKANSFDKAMKNAATILGDIAFEIGRSLLAK